MPYLLCVCLWQKLWSMALLFRTIMKHAKSGANKIMPRAESALFKLSQYFKIFGTFGWFSGFAFDN